MGQGYRQRVAAAASAAMLGGVPLLLSSPAPAFAIDSGREVVFEGGGGLGLVSCGSQPDIATLTVPAESTVRFVNRLNQAATLRLDGRDAARVGRGGVRSVLFHRGPVRVEMVPDCPPNAGSTYSATTVEVTQAPATPGDPPNSPGSTPTGAGSATGSGGQGSGPTRGVPGGGARGATGEVTAVNPDGTPPEDSPTTSAPGIGGVPGTGGSPSAAGATVDGAALQGGWAAEPVAAGEPAGDTGPVGPLALIATVCVVGVSIGTIRAMLTKRAMRTSWV